ncbi:2-C-methyl-D-erythritol 4-phosphate cytidylyltransferase [Mucilaginibacter sp. UR6-11]|uniref:2-C-methyl-D-erythritol 4-phosphate cytidylyltransferase n=1 Tax=Mucilaginibacter sp. UR6-11 TaxID=1435644 RepID=UPI001E54A036|nr:2-C-methyl-D-erythritol 4-phosphate cytidylyltransferase [Mucilaginibacter sp. UR6-11]MCC8426668.1 2-C-methyl-D-erythritol 4-phosphate cytidylyltransferase [Mucilaginibacter sp. UR6-11]
MSQILNLKSHSCYAIIVAGGSGSRMQSALPKQFLLINGLPVLMHTLLAFYNSDTKPGLILVLPADYHEYWQQLCIRHNFVIPHQLAIGGETRFHSVKNGLDLIADNEESIIAVQDAVRPLTSSEIIDNAYKHAAAYGNAVVAVKSRDSIRQLKNNTSVALTRDEIYLVQTPQTFQSAQLKAAYRQEYNPKFTDDASVVEETGVKINLIAGSYQNIKITFPEDVAIAELLLKLPNL